MEINILISLGGFKLVYFVRVFIFIYMYMYECKVFGDVFNLEEVVLD